MLLYTNFTVILKISSTDYLVLFLHRTGISCHLHNKTDNKIAVCFPNAGKYVLFSRKVNIWHLQMISSIFSTIIHLRQWEETMLFLITYAFVADTGSSEHWWCHIIWYKTCLKKSNSFFSLLPELAKLFTVQSWVPSRLDLHIQNKYFSCPDIIVLGASVFEYKEILQTFDGPSLQDKTYDCMVFAVPLKLSISKTLLHAVPLKLSISKTLLQNVISKHSIHV